MPMEVEVVKAHPGQRPSPWGGSLHLLSAPVADGRRTSWMRNTSPDPRVVRQLPPPTSPSDGGEGMRP